MLAEQQGLKKQYLQSLNILRGLAALMVCLCHFGEALKSNNQPNILFEFLHLYGKFGVHIFFVISGFVIPLSFYYGNYSISNYFRFLYKRLLRLQPPYLLAVALTLIIMLVSYKLRHVLFPETVSSIIATCFYFHVPADNPVFWTLAVEAQYYIFIGLFYALAIKFPKISIGLLIPILAILAMVPFVHNIVSLFSYLIFFLIGTVGFFIYNKIGNLLINYLIVIALFVFSFFNYELAAVILSLFTFLVILYFKKSLPVQFQFFGTISYSLYLIHFPIGVKLINLLKFHVNTSLYYLLLLLVLAITVLISWLFSRFVENPSETLSRKIRYKN